MTARPSPAAPADVFPPASTAAWSDLVRAENRGRDPQSMGRQTEDGAARRLAYAASDRPATLAHAPNQAPRGARSADTLPERRPWIALQRHADADLARLAASLRADVAGGVDGLWVDLRASLIGSHAALDAAFDGIDLAALSVLAIDGGGDVQGRLHAALDWLARRGVSASSVAIALRADPLRALAADGALPDSPAKAMDRLADALRRCLGELPRAVPITLSAEPVVEAGGSPALALGWLAADLAWVLRGLATRGIDVATAAPRIELHLPLGRDLFVGIASIRALRLLWDRTLRAFGRHDPPPARIHADGAALHATRLDPWVNMLRTTTQVFAGVVAGADAITALPFDAPLGVPDALGRRVARNTHHVLGLEAHLSDVLDPAGGAHYLEALTDQLARAGWTELQRIEAAGGALSVLRSGWLRAEVDASWTRRAADLATRRLPITGLSEFASVGEPVVSRPPMPALTPSVPGAALPRRRDGASFEALRAATRARPARVLLLPIGPRPEWNARAQWTANLFAAGGFEVLEAEPAHDALDGLLAAAQARGIDAACVVGADARYASAIPALADALGAQLPLYVAGAPGPDGVAWRQRGVRGFAHVGCDVRTLLTDLLDALGVQP